MHKVCILRSATMPAAGKASVAFGLGLVLAGLPIVATAQIANAQSVRRAPGKVSEVLVTSPEVDYGVERSSVSKLTQPLIDTPQSVTVITRAELDDRGITTLSDALRTAPGISLGAGETSWQGPSIVLRGFTTRNDTFLDGMRDYGYYYRDPFNAESIEVLKGPSSILFGRGSTGGVIEQSSKQPLDTRLLDASAQLGTDDTRRLTIDANAPLQGVSGAFRLNAMAHESDVAGRDGAHNTRWGVAPTLALNLDPQTRLMLSYFHQTERDRPDYGIPWFNGAPANVARENFYGFSSDYLNTEVNILTAELKHSFNDHLELSTRARYSNDTREFRTSEAVTPAGVSPTTPLALVTLNRNEFAGHSREIFAQDQTDLTAKFSTGVLRHTVVAGFEVGMESPRPTYVFFVGTPTTNLADPPPQLFSATQTYVRLNAHTDARTVGVYGLDTIDIGDHWQVMAGIRWDRFAAKYNSIGYTPTGAVSAVTNLDHTDEAPSYRAAVIYKPTASLSVYATYGTSFDPSASGIESLVSSGRTVAQSNLNLAPEESRTYEAGVKLAASPRLLLTGAVFRIEKTNVRVPDPVVSGFNTLGGDQRVDGVELEVVGNLTAAWKMHVGYAYMDSETTRSTPGGPLVGKPLPLTPKNTFSVVTEYAITPKLEIGGDLVATSSRLGQDTAASYLTAPGYTLVGLMVKYLPTDRTTVQLNVYNVSDTLYYDQLHPFHVIPGAARSAMLTVSNRF